VEFCLSLLELYSICTIIRSSRLDTLTAQHSTAQHSTAQHSTAQHSTDLLTLLLCACRIALYEHHDMTLTLCTSLMQLSCATAQHSTAHHMMVQV
jgi:hypothetical protein